MTFDTEKNDQGKETGYTKVTVTSQGNGNDVNVKLLTSMSKASEKYLYEVSDKAEGIDRTTGENVSTELGNKNITNRSVALNLSTTGRGNDDEAKMGQFKSYAAFNAKPKNGFDGHIILSTNTNSLIYLDSNTGKYVSVPRHILLFHEMAENYYRTTKKYDFPASHSGANNANTIALSGYLDENSVPNFTQKQKQ